MNDKDYNHVSIENPVGVDIPCERLQQIMSSICFVNKSFGRVQRQKIDNDYRPLYFNRLGGSVNYNHIDLTVSREFSNPMYSFVYPFGEQQYTDEEYIGGLVEVKQKIELICIFNYELFDLQLQTLNHIFIEELKTDISKALRVEGFCEDMKIYDSAEDVFKHFHVSDFSNFMYPYGCLRFEFTSRFNVCENQTSIIC